MIISVSLALCQTVNSVQDRRTNKGHCSTIHWLRPIALCSCVNRMRVTVRLDLRHALRACPERAEGSAMARASARPALSKAKGCGERGGRSCRAARWRRGASPDQWRDLRAGSCRHRPAGSTRAPRPGPRGKWWSLARRVGRGAQQAGGRPDRRPSRAGGNWGIDRRQAELRAVVGQGCSAS